MEVIIAFMVFVSGAALFFLLVLCMDSEDLQGRINLDKKKQQEEINRKLDKLNKEMEREEEEYLASFTKKRNLFKNTNWKNYQ